jgi:hypothetical protein
LAPSAQHGSQPRISVSRRIFAIADDRDRAYFGGKQAEDHFGYIEPEKRAIFGHNYAAGPYILVEQLKGDEAIAAADPHCSSRSPNRLGVGYNADVIEALLKYLAPALGRRSYRGK